MSGLLSKATEEIKKIEYCIDCVEKKNGGNDAEFYTAHAIRNAEALLSYLEMAHWHYLTKKEYNAKKDAE